MCERRDDLALQDEVAEPREERLERPLDGVAQVLLLGVPVALAQVVRRVLDEARHDVLAGRRHVGVDGATGWRRRCTGAELYQPYLRLVEGALEVVHRRPDVGEAAEDVAAAAAGPGTPAARRGRSSPSTTCPGSGTAGCSRRGRRAARAGRRARGTCAAGRARSRPCRRRTRCRRRGRRRSPGRPCVMTESTGDSSRISAPNACAARASTWVNPPLPPLWNAHAPNSPSCSPSEW